MNLKTWQQISEVKSNILNLVKILVTDHVTPRELIAWDILKTVKNVNALEGDFRENTIKDHRLLCQLTEDFLSVTIPEEISVKSFSHWQLVVTLKEMLLSVTNTLLEDQSIRNEVIASRLLGHVYCINQIEEGCIEQLEKTEFPRIDMLCDNIEFERENSQIS
ncbi:hypothetical protein [Neobacillus sp. FSL H8-0543]|uniref:hypothetical protein n=1 Tax=Neobacillus sp. FSL H8-0543 TaxID=2954672 RepID=UPI003158F30A